MIIISVQEYCELMIETYFAVGCSKDIDYLKDIVDNIYCYKHGYKYSDWNLDCPLNEEQEQWVMDTIALEEY